MENQDPAETAQRMLVQCFAWAMQKEFLFHRGLGATTADTKEDFYGFTAADIATIHHHKQGSGRGKYFRLHDNRVFDGMARPQEPDRDLYDATTH